MLFPLLPFFVGWITVGPKEMKMRVVYFWIDSILEGYITEFVVDTITSREVDQKFFQGPCSRYFSFLKTWIKNLVCEKGILRM